MTLAGPILEKLVSLLKGAFNRASLSQIVNTTLNEDMYKVWVNPNQPLVDDIRQLLPKLADLGLLAILLDGIAAAREQLAEPLAAIRDVLGLRTSTTQDQTTAIATVFNDVASQPEYATVRSIVSQSKAILTTMAEKIVLLGAYKHLHDALHDSKAPFKSLQSKIRKIDSDADALNDCVEAVILVERNLSKVTDSFAMLPLEPASVRLAEANWVQSLTDALQRLRESTDNVNIITGKQGVQAIQRIMNSDPSRIDKQISDTASAIDFTRLVEIFGAAITPGSAGAVQTLEQGRIAVEQLSRQIKTHVEKHSSWQSIDNAFIACDDYLKQLPDDPSDFDAMWKGLKDDTTPLIDAEPGSQWAQRLSTCIAAIDTSRKSEDWQGVTRAFTRFRLEATSEFLAIDKKLKELADGVNTLGEPLNNLIANL